MDWDIIGHTWAAELLQKHIATTGLRHAYLFSGPQGVGRRTMALKFAQAINCPSPTALGIPCGSCRTCRQIIGMQQADLTIIQSQAEGESLKVEQVRELQYNLSLAPYESVFRIALLLRFNEATAGAQNALLKTLEEPNERVILLITADEPENLLPTITSRCELIRLRPLPMEVLANDLAQNQNLGAEDAQLIAHIAGGRPGTALRFVADKRLLQIRKEWLDDLFNLTGATRQTRLAYSERRCRGRDRAETKQDLREGMAYWLSLWRDILLITSGADIPLINLDYADRCLALSEKIGVKTAASLVACLEHSFTRLPKANIQLMLDSLLLEWPRV